MSKRIKSLLRTWSKKAVANKEIKMAYDDRPRKKIEVREGKGEGRAGHDELIDRAGNSGQYGVRTDAAAEGAGYLGVDDIDRIRRKNLKHKTR
jgi:hypothetical protein